MSPSPFSSPQHGTALADQEALFFRECMRLVGRSLEPDQAITELLHLMSELLGLNRGRIVLFDAVSGQLRARYSYGLTQDEVSRCVYAPGEGITGLAYECGKPLVVPDVAQEPRFLGRVVPSARLPAELATFIAVPLIVEGCPAGVLAVHRLRLPGRALAQDMDVLRHVGVLVAQMLGLHGRAQARIDRLDTQLRRLRLACDQSTAAPLGATGQSARVLEALAQACLQPGPAPFLLITGETGTGKSHLVRMLRALDTHTERTFVHVNCEAYDEKGFDAALLGRATQCRVFLDEIDALPLQAQASLVDTLQHGHAEACDGVRLLASSRNDLRMRVVQGCLLPQLYALLPAEPLHLPALRERREDIRLFVRAFVAELDPIYGYNSQIMPDALSALTRHPWPGNVRQLRQVTERLVLTAAGAPIDAAMVETLLRMESRLQRTANSARSQAARPYQPVRTDERASILQALQDAGGNKSRAAQRLGLTLRQLSYRLQRLQIDPSGGR